MGYDICEYCDLESKTKSARSSINRHIKNEALKPKEQRGPHPGVDDESYIRTAERRRFHSDAGSMPERMKNNSIRNAKYRDKRKLQDDKKVEAAFKKLQ